MLVSIITPTYNRAALLPETIESVLGQDYPDLEYIVIDDGSNDETPRVLERYASRLRIERHSNIGETATVNKGLALASGDIICVVNSDDPLLPGAVRHAVDAFSKDPGALAVYPDWNEIGPSGEVLRTWNLPDYNALNILLNLNFGIGPGTFFKRETLSMVGYRNPNLVYCGDMEFWGKIAMHGRLVHVPHVLATHRVHSDSASVSQRSRRLADEWIGVWRTLLNHPKSPPELLPGHDEIIGRAHDIAGKYYCGADKWYGRGLRLRGAMHRMRWRYTVTKRQVHWR